MATAFAAAAAAAGVAAIVVDDIMMIIEDSFYLDGMLNISVFEWKELWINVSCVWH